MRKLIMILSILLFILAIPLFSQSSDRTAINNNLPKILGNSGGLEYYFSVIPSYESQDSNNVVSLYFSSTVRTRVLVTIEGKSYEKILYTIPNDIVVLNISTGIAQPYKKTIDEKPEIDKIWEDYAIHIRAYDPIICYVLTHHHSNDGFLAIPTEKLGTKYIISSFENSYSVLDTSFAPSYTSITAVYDKTDVDFIMGGNEWSTTMGGTKSGDTSVWKMNKGDVLLIASSGANSDLTGSIVNANKPVAVVSGNYFASIPNGSQGGGFIQNMEFPMVLWGKEYLVPNISGRKKNSIIRIFAKESNTTIYRDYHQIGFIKNAGGNIGSAYLQIRSDEGIPRPVIISGDKQINVVQFNTSKSDDGTKGAPFEIGLTPVNRLEKEVIFNTAGIKGDKNFDKYYVNICYEATQYGTMPDDLELATVKDGKFAWQQIADLSPDPGVPFTKLKSGKTFYSKTLLLPDGVYKIRSCKPFVAYTYGIADKDSYGYSTSISTKYIFDILPPQPNWQMTCNGNVLSGYVKDKSIDSNNISNLSSVYIHSDLSYNYKFYVRDFKPCEDNSTTWGLNVLDNCQDANAVITFTDCAGNDTTIFIKYTAMKMKIIPESWDFGKINLGDSVDKLFYIVNSSKISSAELKNIQQLDTTQDYSFWNVNGTNILQFPKTIEPLDSLPFIIRFNAISEGEFSNSIGLKDSCNVCFKANVNSSVGQPVIYVSDCTFPPTQANKISWNYFDIKNIGPVNLTLFGYKGPYIMGVNQDGNTYKVFSSQNLDNANIDSALGKVLILKSGVTQTFQIKFSPDKEKSYLDSIVFISNSANSTKDGISFDNVCLLNGTGIPTSVKDNLLNKSIKISPNPARNRLDISIDNDELIMKSIKITDINGYEIYSVQLSQNLNSLDISLFPNGSYFLSIMTNKGLMKHKFMILH